MFVFGQAQQTIDQRRQIPQAGLQMALNSMIQLFGMKQLSHPTQIGFDREALIPTAALTQFDVPRRGILFPQAQVGKCDCLAFIVDQPGQLNADDPAPVRDTFLADLPVLRPSRRGWINSIFQAKQQTNRDNLTGIQMRVGTLIDMAKLVVYHAKQADDLVRGHTVLRLYKAYLGKPEVLTEDRLCATAHTLACTVDTHGLGST
jgi:hypothetical protein